MNNILNIKKYFKKGFTLTELLVVVAILALLVILGIWAYQRQLAKGWDARRKSDLSKIKVAVEEYEKDHDCYPAEELLNCNPGSGLIPYIQSIPCDPRTKTSYEYVIPDDSCPHSFLLYSVLDNRNDPIMTKINCTNNCGPSCAFQYYVSSGNIADTTTCVASTGSGSPLPHITQPPGAYYWGCINGVCVNLAWDTEMGKPVCEPNYPSQWACGSTCSQGETTCIDIR